MTSHDLAQKTLQQMGVSENSGFSPQIIHFNRVFHYKPSILGAHPYFLETPTCTSSYRRTVERGPGDFVELDPLLCNQPWCLDLTVHRPLGSSSPWLCLPLDLDDFFLGGNIFGRNKSKKRPIFCFFFKMRPFGKSPTLSSSTQLPIMITCSILIHVNTVLKVTRTLMDPNLNLRYHLCRKSWGIDGGRSSEMPWKKCQPQPCGCGPSQDSIKHIVLTCNDMKWHENNTMHVIDAYLILHL